MSAGPLSSGEWRRLRLAILDRDAHLCQIHGPRCTRYATEVDHVIGRADGGPVFDPTNLRAACSACNGRRAAERTNAYRLSVAAYECRM